MDDGANMNNNRSGSEEVGGARKENKREQLGREGKKGEGKRGRKEQ